MTIHLIDRDDYAGAYKISNKQKQIKTIYAIIFLLEIFTRIS